MEDDQEKKTAFYLSAYRKELKDQSRQYQRWIDQVDKRMEGDSAITAVHRYQEKLEETKRLMLISGPESEHFQAYMTEQLETLERQQSNQSRRMESCLKDAEDKKKRLEEYTQKQREERRAERQTKYQIQRETERYFSIHDTLPPYIRDNLRTMPHNKGYVFRGVWYFGSRPLGRHDNPDVITMQERQGSTLYLHEYKAGEYHKVYEKKNKEAPVLVRVEGPSLLGQKI